MYVSLRSPLTPDLLLLLHPWCWEVQFLEVDLRRRYPRS